MKIDGRNYANPFRIVKIVLAPGAGLRQVEATGPGNLKDRSDSLCYAPERSPSTSRMAHTTRSEIHMKMLDRVGLAVLGLALAGFFASSAGAQDLPSEPTNLQVLPKTTTMAELKTIMVGVATAMGEKCAFCHDVKNYASDENEHKKTARKMFAMVRDINTQFFAYEGAPQITCYTCHRGASKPVHQFSLPAQEKKGSTAK
jgi:photosynthetic reaction center cytochrome c subunit